MEGDPREDESGLTAALSGCLRCKVMNIMTRLGMPTTRKVA